MRALYRRKAIPRFVGVDALLTELTAVRRRGHALMQPDDDPAEQTLGVAIDGEPAAIAVSGNIVARPDRAVLIESLHRAAGQIARRV